MTAISYRALHRIADKLTPPMRRAFLEAIRGVRGALNVSELERLIRENPNALESGEIWQFLESELGSAMREPIREAVLQTGTAYAPAGMRFDLTNPQAIRAVEATGASLVQGISAENRAAIRGLVLDSFANGVPPRELARRIREHIGLTERYSQAVERYRARRIQAVGEARGNRQAARYAEELLRDRATNIARTEIIGAASAGQQAAWLDAQARGLLPPNQQRTWIVTPDDRLCMAICAPMDGQVRGLQEPFTTGEGLEVMTPPAHPQCRCAVGLVFP